MPRMVSTLVFKLLALGGIAAHQAFPQSTNPSPNPFRPDTPSGSVSATDLRFFGPNPDGWLFPITRLDELLPHWIQFGGQFRNRVESQTGLGYAPVDDAYNLTQFRLGVYLQPTKWLEIVGVTQDSRAFFNHHVLNAPPY